jgi:hypothetical protein
LRTFQEKSDSQFALTQVAVYIKNGAGEARKQPDKQNSYPLVIREGVWRGFGELLPEQSFDFSHLPYVPTYSLIPTWRKNQPIRILYSETLRPSRRRAKSAQQALSCA